MKMHRFLVAVLFFLTTANLAVAQTITTVAGGDVVGFSGDGGPADRAKLYSPTGIAIDSSDNLLFSDNLNLRIRKISASGTISTVAGNGQSSGGNTVSFGPALATPLFNPPAVGGV